MLYYPRRYATGDKMDEKLLKELYKRALGYYVTETVVDYDAEGNVVKKKKTKKFLPPDMAALKEYLALKSGEDDLSQLSDGELFALRDKYLTELKEIDEEE